MSRRPLPIVITAFALALLVVPAAFAKHGHRRADRIQGVCTQQSTSKLKLKREDRGTKIEFELDQNQNGIPWTVTVSVNGSALASFTATTSAPSGSFEIRRLITGLLRTDRVTVVATQAASGETCTADNSPGAMVTPTTPTVTNPTDDNDNDDDNGNDDGGDHGHDSGGHS